MSMTLPASTPNWLAIEAYDRFYTPETLSRQVVSLVDADRVDTVVDFAAGVGSLLKAAAKRWPLATLHANEIDCDAIPSLRSLEGRIVIEASDFLAPEPGGDVTASGRSYDVILLNPPFTQRGGRYSRPRGEHCDVTCSRAMAFVLTALPYLRKSGQLVAVLPTSTLYAEMDRTARKRLSDLCNFEVLVPPDYGHFHGLDVSVYVLRLSPRRLPVSDWQLRARPVVPVCGIQRGVVSVRRRDRIEASEAGWIHTTGLVGQRIATRYRLPEGSAGRLCPPGAIVLPRVGRINVGHLVLLEELQQETLSDCLLSLSFARRMDAECVFERLLAEFESLRRLYVGTGAPYVTNATVSRFIAKVWR